MNELDIINARMSAHDEVKLRAGYRGAADCLKGKARDAGQYGAKPGSAWEKWYNAGYDKQVKFAEDNIS